MQYFTDQNCPVCNIDCGKTVYSDLIHTCNVLQKAEIPFTNEDVQSNVIECKNCGHRYLSKSLTDEKLDFYYNVVETEYYDWQKTAPQDHRPKETRKFAEFIKKRCANNSTLLEIGSGLGFLLKELESLGLECYGVEPSRFASNYSREKLELNITTGMLTKTTYGNIKFNTIVLSDVIEHISDPNKLFSLIKYYLADNGKVIIFTGNSHSLYARICGKKWLYFYSWEHISFFNRGSMGFLFMNNSLKLVHYKNVAHTGTFYQNLINLLKTIVLIILDRLKIRKYNFYLMAFDHFVAIGEKTVKQ